MSNSRETALETARKYVTDGALIDDLRRRVAYRSASPLPTSTQAQNDYLTKEILPTCRAMGMDVHIEGAGTHTPCLIATRVEDASLPTILVYGHGDTVAGMEGQWHDNRDPWTLCASGERLYGRGMADNKGQHTVNLAALACVLRCRGRLGFNVKFLLEMAEEVGSPGLRALCHTARDMLAADVLIASDGPRVAPDMPTLFLGSRGTVRLRLDVHLRHGAHHSGNWGGLISNAATVLCHALASLVDRNGCITVKGLRPDDIPGWVRTSLRSVGIEGGEGQPMIEPAWGEPGLSAAEKVFAWNTLEVTGLRSGHVDTPVSAIPGHAEGVLQLRFVNALDWRAVGPIIAKHLSDHDFPQVQVTTIDGGNATSTTFENPWIGRVVSSMRATTGKDVALLPNFGGTLPNDIFVEELHLPTLWIPHSYLGCNQHAPDEHNLMPLLEEAIIMMTGLFWDIGMPNAGNRTDS